MLELLDKLYYQFAGMYCGELDTFLVGDYGDGGSNLYIAVGLITLAVSLVVMLLYYYVFANPRLSNWWTWLLTMLFNGVVSMFIAAGISLSKFNAGAIPEDLVQYIYTFDCWMFGTANMLISFIFFVFFSFTLKWWSAQAKHVPFF